MALIINDRVKETSTTTGTGTLNLAGAEQGYESFVSGIGTTNKTFYAIENNSAGEFEVGEIYGVKYIERFKTRINYHR